MKLTVQQYKQIEDLAAINYSLEQISMYLDIDHRSFLDAFNLPGSQIKYHYDRGQLITQAEIDKANIKKAKDGSLASIQQWKKDTKSRKLENFKKQILYDNPDGNYCQLQGLIERGETDNLPAIVVKYYEQLDFIRSLYNKFKDEEYILSMVRFQWKEITPWMAKKLYNETLNFFYLDNQVKSEAWANIYADQLDKAALIALEMLDFKSFRDMKELAGRYRGVGKEKPPEVPGDEYRNRPVIYVMDPEKLGIPKVNRRDLAKMIDELDILESQKVNLRRDAEITDVSFELVENEDE